MSGTISIILEELGFDSSLEVEVKYDFQPCEPMVRYYPDGSGYPGCSSSAEWTFINVTVWRVGEETRYRTDHWIWDALDKIAEAVIERDWHERYEEQCLQDAASSWYDEREHA